MLQEQFLQAKIAAANAYDQNRYAYATLPGQGSHPNLTESQVIVTYAAGQFAQNGVIECGLLPKGKSEVRKIAWSQRTYDNLVRVIFGPSLHSPLH